MQSDPSIATIAQEYRDLRDRRANPAGKFDRAGRFTVSERCEACERLRGPSRAWPYAELTHARTLKHVAAIRNVDARTLRRAVKEIDS